MSVALHINHQLASVEAGKSLFESADAIGVYVPTSCQKQGKCKECMVEVTHGMEFLSPRVAKEHHLSGNLRLACQARVVANRGIIRCHTMRRGEMRIERQAFHLPVLDQPLPLDPPVVRRGREVWIDRAKVDERDGPIHGVAMDLGTTTVVLRLLNLETGEIVADASFENPQRFGGSDVMSRIRFDTEHPERLLQRTLAGYLSHAIERFPVEPHSIYELVMAGNSTMRDIFFGLSVYSIGQNPYQSITELELHDGKRSSTSLCSAPNRLHLPINPRGRVYGLPIISGHVGADAAACLMAVNMADEERLVAVMDIGTNTELLLGNREKILAASCPAGPAFEGGRIRFGMPALPGAVDEVRIEANGTVARRVLGGVAAEGICGSGLIDSLSELRRTGRINGLGRFDGDEPFFVIDATTEPPITLSEADINELAQAKGANVAGLSILFDRYGARFDDVERFYLAGGFGRHLNVEAAMRVGLIPKLDPRKVVQVGNASIEGATAVLLSQQKRQELEQLVKRVVHTRLETHPAFFDFFVEGCQFIPVESSRQLDLAK